MSTATVKNVPQPTYRTLSMRDQSVSASCSGMAREAGGRVHTTGTRAKREKNATTKTTTTTKVKLMFSNHKGKKTHMQPLYTRAMPPIARMWLHVYRTE
jgi:hypothetical protein